MENIPRLWSLYHNSGTLACERTGPRSVRFSLFGFGLPNLPLCECSLAYWAEAVTLAGGLAVGTKEEQHDAPGHAGCVYALQWT